jgi:glycosyltransferase involved in cell wall biosynthesis
MAEILLTVSGTIPADIAQQVRDGQRPRVDYLELANRLPADLLDYPGALAKGGWLASLAAKLLGRNAALAWACFSLRTTYPLVFTDGEQVGIFLALLFKIFGRGRLNTRHMMIVHKLTVPKKLWFFDLFRIQKTIDAFLVYSTYQKQFIQQRLGVAAEKVIWIPFQVDQEFFNPRICAVEQEPGLICSAGLEFRDYPTLIDALEGLDAKAILAAASPWSKRSDSSQQRVLPKNVVAQRFSLFDLRRLYARSSLVVVPLFATDFQAGVTTILEAMSMEKAVIVTRTQGQTDVVEDNFSGIYVPVGDSSALRDAIRRLLDDPQEAARLGRNARAKVESQFNLDYYVRLLKSIAENLVQKKGKG